MNTSSEQTETKAGTVATWDIDTGHSSVEFSIRHMVVGTFSARFDAFSADITFDENRLEKASVVATVDVASVNTSMPALDGHLQGEDFFNSEQFPTMTFRSERFERDGDDFKIYGDLTIRGVTRQVVMDAEYGGEAVDAWGGIRSGLVAETTINRQNFGINYHSLLEGGGLALGNDVKIKLNIEAKRGV